LGYVEESMNFRVIISLVQLEKILGIFLISLLDLPFRARSKLNEEHNMKVLKLRDLKA